MARRSLKISRRAVLKGLAGGALVSVALPPLEAMMNDHGEAYSGASNFPARYVTFFFGNGILYNKWIPATTGPDYALSEQLAPLVNVKEYCTVLTGFENKIRPQITHHEGAAGFLSGYPFVSPGGLYSSFGGPSLDQYIASYIGGESFLPSIQLGVSKRVSGVPPTADEGPTMHYISHQSTAQPLPPTYSPVDMWNRLFGSFVPPDDPSGALRISALDAVAEDTRRLQALVGAEDKARLDAHLTSVAALQEQIAALPPICEIPTAPSETNVDTLGREHMPEVSKAMIDLLVYSFKCDITRVASFMLTGGVGATVYSHLGHTEENHIMSHSPFSPQFAVPFNQSIIWNVSQYAYLLEQLKATPEGARNLLDNAVVLLGSDCGEGWAHSTEDHPLVVAGGGAGRLRTGFHYRAMNDRNMSDVLLTCAMAVDPAISQVGASMGFSNTPVLEMLA